MSGTAESLGSLLRLARGEETTAVVQIPGGANSTVWRLHTPGGRSYLAKLYFRRPGDTADRLATEFSGLSFLWEHGVRAIAQPIARDDRAGIGIYEFVEGTKLDPGGVNAEHVDQAAAFLRELHALGNASGAESLPAAKESCLTLDAYLEVVLRRLERLEKAAAPGNASLREFLRDALRPFHDAAAAWVRTEAGRLGLGMDDVLRPAERVLSPSDFGFHNAILRADGRLVFIDFEYWGWDDPAKMVADFWLQPAIPVPPDLRKRFHDAVADFLGPGNWRRRLPLVHLVLSLKWCLIALNPFLRSGEPPILLDARLADARRYLERARREFQDRTFPLGSC